MEKYTRLMAKHLITYAPDAQVLGVAVAGLFTALAYENYAHILTRYGLNTFDRDELYPQQLILDILKEIRDQVPQGGFYLADIGYATAQDISPEHGTLRHDLRGLAQAYPGWNRKAGGRIWVETTTPGPIRVIDNTPYPHEMIYGILLEHTQRYGMSNQVYELERTAIEKNPEFDDEQGIYEITFAG